MSDSYSAWREEREENSEKYEKLKDHFEKIKDTKEFKEKLRNAEKEFKSFKFTACKRCFNCKHFSSDYTDSYGDTINLCLKNCINLNEWGENYVCDKWALSKDYKTGMKNHAKYFSVNPFVVSLKKDK